MLRLLAYCPSSFELPQVPTPANVYFGRADAMLAERARIKRQTIQHRRLQHRKLAA
jgi:hypothetical protein